MSHIFINGHLDYFYTFSYCENAAVNLRMHISLQDTDFIVLKKYIAEVGLLEYMVILFRLSFHSFFIKILFYF